MRSHSDIISPKSPAGYVATSGFLVAVSLIFSYIESLIPFVIPIPGAKLGLANLVTLTGLFFLSPGQVFLIMLSRIVLSGFLFGNFSTIIYSLSGGILSFVIMLIAKKTKILSPLGVSILGGVSHNMGQLAVACFVVESLAPSVYLPYLVLLGTVTGCLIGIIGRTVHSHL